MNALNARARALSLSPRERSARYELILILALSPLGSPQVNPRCATCFKNWAEVLMARDDHAAARDKLATALELTPQDSDAHFSLGNARKAAGDVDGAIEAYRSSLAINADDHDLLYNLATLLGDAGRTPEEARRGVSCTDPIRTTSMTAMNNHAQIL